ncbi:MAG: S41 family peptidase [Chitinophagaceae bacterium]|nr:S41 family peptidase [Chitinophagaceae bacterium]
MSNRKINAATPILFSIALVLGMFIGYKLRSNMPMTKSFLTSPGSNTLNEVMQLIKQRYVDKVNVDSASSNAINGLVNTLDPHSVYIPTSELTDITEDLEGQFQGIGIEFNIFNDTVHILSVLENGPAKNAGLTVGDRILAVNDSIATGLKDSEQLKKWVKGPAGSTVNIRLMHEGKVISKSVVRGSIPITSLDASYMIDKSKGYIRLNRFSSNTYKEFLEALEKLKAAGMTSLVLDLRDNGGGILEEAIDIIDEFIGGEKLIVFTEGQNSPKKEYKAKRAGLFETGDLVVLMNEGSASASEVIAGALQDHDRAMIVGRRSFGKGLVQEQYVLSDGSALRLTIARYYTPLGRSIQKPYNEGHAKYNMEVLNRVHNHDSAASNAGTKLGKSFKTAKGKVLYGGGGITPDAVVEIDPVLFDTSLNALYQKNIIGNFAYRYFLTNSVKIKAFADASTFASGFNVDDNVINQLTDFAQKQGVVVKLNSNASINWTKLRIKAMVARIAWSETGYFQVLNKSDIGFVRAVETIGK